MTKVVLPDDIDIPQVYKDQLVDMGVIIYDDLPQTPLEIIERIKDAEVITANYIDITPEIINASPQLKYIISPAVGFDWIDDQYAAQKGIKVMNCPTYNSQAVAEHAIALMFGIARHLPQATKSLNEGSWTPPRFMGSELAGKQLGLIGHGNIGKRIEQMATGIGMIVNFADSKSSAQQIDKLMLESDIICICAALNKTTHHMIDRRRLNLIKPEAFLINVSRGGLIDQTALIEVLLAKGIAAAGLDVFESEPLTGAVDGSILDLVRLDNVLATPHIAYNTADAMERLGLELVSVVKAAMSGQPINMVN